MTRKIKMSRATMSFGTEIDDTMTVFSKPIEVKDLKITISAKDKGRQQIKRPMRGIKNA